MSASLPQRRHGTHLPPQAYRRAQPSSTPAPQGGSSWFEAATPADQPQTPESEWPTEDIDAAAATADTQVLPVVPAEEVTQVMAAVRGQPEENRTPAPRDEETVKSSVLSDPRDIAFRDRLLSNLHRIRGFGER